MSVLDDRHLLFEDSGTYSSTCSGTGSQDGEGQAAFSVERVRDPGGDQIHVRVGDSSTVFGSDHFLEILRKLHWAVAIDRGIVLPESKPGT